jgi:hypothetical protein
MSATPQSIGIDRAFIDRLLDIFPYVVVFLLSLAHPIDLDLGWHLKYGEHIFLNHALLQENSFSTSMPGYRYLNHSWGSELILYTAFRNGGFLGISLLGATLITITFFFLARAATLDRWCMSILFPAMLFMLNGVIQQSFRSQYFSFLGIAVLVYLLGKFEQHHKKMAVLIPLLFLLWANLHGQFIMGLGIFSIWLVFYYLRANSGKNPRPGSAISPFYPIGIIFISTLATMINPYGIELYQEIFRHFGNPLQKFITEWQPINLSPVLLGIFLAWSSFLFLSVIIGRTWKDLTNHGHFLVPLLLFFLATFDQRRYFWPLILLSIPAAIPLLEQLKPSRQGLANSISFTVLAIGYLFAVVEKLPAQQLFSFNWDAYCRYNSFSPNSAELLKKIAPGHKLFNDYNQGGWLIWNYPELKPVVDGRMPFWQDDKGYSAYQEYLDLEQGRADIDASPYDLVYWPPHKAALYGKLTTLTAAGKWRHLYDDPFASIFVRNSDRDQRDSHGEY